MDRFPNLVKGQLSGRLFIPLPDTSFLLVFVVMSSAEPAPVVSAVKSSLLRDILPGTTLLVPRLDENDPNITRTMAEYNDVTDLTIHVVDNDEAGNGNPTIDMSRLPHKIVSLIIEGFDGQEYLGVEFCGWDRVPLTLRYITVCDSVCEVKNFYRGIASNRALCQVLLSARADDATSMSVSDIVDMHAYMHLALFQSILESLCQGESLTVLAVWLGVNHLPVFDDTNTFVVPPSLAGMLRHRPVLVGPTENDEVELLCTLVERLQHEMNENGPHYADVYLHALMTWVLHRMTAAGGQGLILSVVDFLTALWQDDDTFRPTRDRRDDVPGLAFAMCNTDMESFAAYLVLNHPVDGHLAGPLLDVASQRTKLARDETQARRDHARIQEARRFLGQ